jgi:DNA-binding transcriptional regulator YhcF (GntR family)
LSPEDGLVERFKISRTIVRKAIQNLVERGLVEVRRARALSSPGKIADRADTGFVEDMQALERTPTARLLDKRIVALHNKDYSWSSITSVFRSVCWSCALSAAKKSGPGSKTCRSSTATGTHLSGSRLVCDLDWFVI